MVRNSNQSGMLHPLQLRAARLFLEWSVPAAVAAIGISSATLNRAERPGSQGVTDVVLNAMRLTYENHGIEFINDGGIGVKRRDA
jgi:hypothetical protein